MTSPGHQQKPQTTQPLTAPSARERGSASPITPPSSARSNLLPPPHAGFGLPNYCDISFRSTKTRIVAGLPGYYCWRRPGRSAAIEMDFISLQPIPKAAVSRVPSSTGVSGLRRSSGTSMNWIHRIFSAGGKATPAQSTVPHPSPPPLVMSTTLLLCRSPIMANSNVAGEPFLCPRTETVQALMHMIDEHKLVHVRGTPACGKSTLARQLCTAFNSQNRLAVYIPLYDGAVKSYLTAFMRYASACGHSSLDRSLLTTIRDATPST